MINKLAVVIGVVIALILIIIIGSIYFRQANAPVVESGSPSPLVGGDKDAHGCIGSAGYMWCAPKNKCLRIWEEPCYESVQQEVQYILADKYSKNPAEVKITITKNTGSYASGGVLFGQGGPGEGGIFLAMKTGNAWQIVYDGNGSIDCNKMRQEYKFPDEILKPNFCN